MRSSISLEDRSSFVRKLRVQTFSLYIPTRGIIHVVMIDCGNEADVGLYVNATGLIWENAEVRL
jgi:hypothetical protein